MWKFFREENGVILPNANGGTDLVPGDDRVTRAIAAASAGDEHALELASGLAALAASEADAALSASLRS
jgi:hypothetical protein